MAIRIGIDSGGTFTDLVGFDEHQQSFVLAKHASTPDHPSRALQSVLSDASLVDKEWRSVVVATTVATNAVLQRKGARVLFVTTKGFEDVQFIGRLDKEELYNLHWKKPQPLVERSDCFGIEERVDHHGEILVPLEDSELDRLTRFLGSRVESTSDVSVAVCLLFSYKRSDHEVRIRDYIHSRFPKLAVSISSEIAPVWREYERGSTTIGDAFVKPIVRDYVSGVQSALADSGSNAPASMLKSNGGHLGLDHVAEQPAQFLVSGLAGGIVAARSYAQLAGADHVFSLDMGGTSADIGVIENQLEKYISEFNVGFGIPIIVQSVDVSTLGAGGGSIAWIDKGGLLQVGPRSAGAVPGPICYGAGGKEPTTTDANLALGRLNADFFLGGRVRLFPDLARTALETIGEKLGADSVHRLETASQAIVDTANENMANQIRLLAVDRGLDLREFTLIPFGGAGPVHGADCARLLGIRRMLIPPHPGLSSAFGALAADLRVDRSWTLLARRTSIDTEVLDARFNAMVRESVAELNRDGFADQPIVYRSIDMRYAGQNYEREVPVPPGRVTSETLGVLEARLGELHDKFYGFSLQGEMVEFVTLRVTAVGSNSSVTAVEAPPATESPVPIETRMVSLRNSGFVPVPIYRRQSLPAGFGLQGPAIIEESDSTTVIHPQDSFVVRSDGLIDVTVGAEKR